MPYLTLLIGINYVTNHPKNHHITFTILINLFLFLYPSIDKSDNGNKRFLKLYLIIPNRYARTTPIFQLLPHISVVPRIRYCHAKLGYSRNKGLNFALALVTG